MRVQIFNSNASSIAGELPVDHATPQLWVENPGHAALARTIIEAFLRSSTTGPPLHCAACGEESPSSFDVCWSCGKPLA